MREAYKQANKFVEDNYNDGMCTVGPDSFLKCWKLEKGCKAKFKRISENILLWLLPWTFKFRWRNKSYS